MRVSINSMVKLLQLSFVFHVKHYLVLGTWKVKKNIKRKVDWSFEWKSERPRASYRSRWGKERNNRVPIQFRWTEMQGPNCM
jgi:hypothetical protein